MKNIKLPNSDVCQSVLDAINHRLKVHEEALAALSDDDRDDDDELESDTGTEVQNILNDNPTAEYLTRQIENLKIARSAVGSA